MGVRAISEVYMETYVVTSLAEYISVTSAIARESEEIWFRGHSSASHRLEPSVLRDTVPLTDFYGNKVEAGHFPISEGGVVGGISAERMFENFKRKAAPFINKEPKNDFEWMFLMQHYGVPTRLLDWTTNALVALYFAIESMPSNEDSFDDEELSIEEYLLSSSGEFSEHAAAVFAMCPKKYNDDIILKKNIIPISEEYEQWKHYVNPMSYKGEKSNFLPIAVSPTHIDDRIRAQSGYFTLHGANIWPVDYYDTVRSFLHKIMIPYKDIPTMVRDLEAVGVTDSLVFPDLSGLAKEVLRKERHTYKP